MEATFKTVMLIDDDAIDNALNKKLILATDFAENIIVMQTIKDALNFFKNDSAEDFILPEVIFLDIRMPLGDGFKFLKEYQTLPDKITAKMKIVMLTSSLHEDDYQKASDNALIKIFLNKPLSFKALDDLKQKL